MADGSVTLSREEAKELYDWLSSELSGLDGSNTSPAGQRAMLRVALKLRKAAGNGYYPGEPFDQMPDWMMEQLYQTFIPAPGAKPKPKPTPPATPRGGQAKARSRPAPAKGGSVKAVPPAGGIEATLDPQDLADAHAAIDKSHRSAAEKAAAHRALNEAAAAR